MAGIPSVARPERHRVLSEHTGVVAGAPDAVFAALAVAVDPAPWGGLLVDTDSRLAVVQGDYWYRGEYRVVPAEHGARVDYAIVNVAQRGPMILGEITGRSVVRDAPTTFAKLLLELGKVAGA